MTYHPVPKPTETVTITGKLVYTGGPWGTNRRVRHAIVNYLLHTSDSIRTGIDSTGIPVGTASVDADGRFFLEAFADGVPQNPQPVEDVLELQEPITNEWDAIPIDGIVWGKSGVQDVGVLKVTWDPPLKTLASVDSERHIDIRYLAAKLVKLLKRSPDWPASALATRIRLQREDPQNSLGFDTVKELFQGLASGGASQFAYSLVYELDKIPGFSSRSDSFEGMLIDYLDAISRMDIKRIEQGDFLNNLLLGLWKAQGKYPGGFTRGHDTGPDAAAVCVLLYCAARMIIDDARVSVKIGSRATRPSVGGQHKYTVIDVFVTGE